MEYNKNGFKNNNFIGFRIADFKSWNKYERYWVNELKYEKNIFYFNNGNIFEGD